VDLHPEDLLDKEARGVITALEQQRLDAHMDRCDACRVERQMRADFADEMDGEDPRISVSALLALVDVEKSNAAADARAEELAASLSRRGIGVRRGVTRATWLIAAAAVFAASVAGAAGATGIGQRAWSSLVGAEPAPVVTVASVSRPAPRHVTRHASPTPLAPPAPTVDVLSTPEPAPVAAPRVLRAPALVATHPHVVTTAATLFEAANDARRHGDYTKSLGLHRDLESRFPTSPEAHLSRATTGQLLLDLGDPTGALASFDGYLATGSGELGEEVMVGRATALERLGRADDARRAWQALLAAFPDSPYAAHAKRRLSTR
jgi:TolA-binding protein